MAVDSQVQFAAVLIPILGLLITSAADTVDENDDAWGGWYRIFVYGVSMAAIGPITISSLLAILSVGIRVNPNAVLFHAVLSVILSVGLILGVTHRESTRGMDESDTSKFVIGGVIVLLYYLALFVVGP